MPKWGRRGAGGKPTSSSNWRLGRPVPKIDVTVAIPSEICNGEHAPANFLVPRKPPHFPGVYNRSEPSVSATVTNCCDLHTIRYVGPTFVRQMFQQNVYSIDQLVRTLVATPDPYALLCKMVHNPSAGKTTQPAFAGEEDPPTVKPVNEQALCSIMAYIRHIGQGEHEVALGPRVKALYRGGYNDAERVHYLGLRAPAIAVARLLDAAHDIAMHNAMAIEDNASNPLPVQADEGNARSSDSDISTGAEVSFHGPNNDPLAEVFDAIPDEALLTAAESVEAELAAADTTPLTEGDLRKLMHNAADVLEVDSDGSTASLE